VRSAIRLEGGRPGDVSSVAWSKTVKSMAKHVVPKADGKCDGDRKAYMRTFDHDR
jgi:hypothetical protein